MRTSTTGSEAVWLPTFKGKLADSLFDTLFPDAHSVHRVAAAAVFIALIILCAKGRFYLPENPTPVTLQTFGVLLTGSVLGWRWGVASVLGYIALGGVGLPVFASSDPWTFRSPAEAWDQTFLGPTAGYIIGFVVAAGVAGWLSQRGLIRSGSLWANATAGLLLYVPALIWLSAFDFGWPAQGKLFEEAMYIYMPGDILKILGASLVVAGSWKYGEAIIANLRNR